MHELSVLLDFEFSIPSNFSFSFFKCIFPQLLLPFYFHKVSGNIVYSLLAEMASTDESLFYAGYEPKDYFFMEIYVESLTGSLTQPQFFEEVDYDNAALEDMLDNAHREHVYHSQREGFVRVRKNGETRC